MSIDLDKTSSDFGEIRVGNTRFNPLFGITQAYRFVSRMVTGKAKSPGDKEPRKIDRMRVLGNEFRNKLAPVPSMGWTATELATDTKPPPQYPQTALELAGESVTPLSYEDFKKATGDLGIAGGLPLDCGLCLAVV